MKTEAVKTEEYQGYTIELYQDTCPLHPREEWDNLGTIVHWHRRYDLGEEQLTHDQARQIDRNGGFYKWLEEERGAEVILPLTFLDHGIQSIRVGHGAWDCDPGGWDSGTVGFIYADKETILNWYQEEELTEEVLGLAEKELRAEVEEFDSYMRGDVYGWVVKDPWDDVVDSCWGYFGWDYAEETMTREAKKVVDYKVNKAIEDHAEQVKAWIKHRVPLEHREPLQIA